MPLVTVDVDIDLDDIESEDLIDELESRGYEVLEKDSLSHFNYGEPSLRDIAEKVYWQVRDGAQSSPELRELIKVITGKYL